MTKEAVLIIDPVGSKAGMDYYDLNLAAGLRHCGIKTYIASNFDDGSNCKKVFNSEKNLSKKNKAYDLIKGFIKAIFFAKRNKINYVVIHVFSTEVKDFITTFLLKISGLKIISIAHDVSGFANTDLQFVKKAIFKTASHKIIVHNQYSKQSFESVMGTNTNRKLRLIPHGSFINLPNPAITRSIARRKLQLSEDEKIILFFGQIKKVKGLDVLIKALPLVNDNISLIIAGKPWKDEFDAYEELIEMHSLKNRIKKHIRYIPDNERELFFKSADLLIIPYRKIYQSGVLLMGMSYKLPVLASDIEANKELIEHNFNGFLFQDGNHEDLAEKINGFFNLNQENVAENSYNILQEKFNWEMIGCKYKRVINEDSNNRF